MRPEVEASIPTAENEIVLEIAPPRPPTPTDLGVRRIDVPAAGPQPQLTSQQSVTPSGPAPR
jgi:hypothetical protein